MTTVSEHLAGDIGNAIARWDDDKHEMRAEYKASRCDRCHTARATGTHGPLNVCEPCYERFLDWGQA